MLINKTQRRDAMKKLLVSLLLVVFAGAFTFAAGLEEYAPMPEPQPDIIEVAVSDGRFTTLAAALGAAGLVETLQGEGPFTVFAPTDDAFAKLPAGTVEALLNDIPTLTDILLYHVVSGKVMAADVVGLSSADAVNGDSISISLAEGGVKLNDSNVIIIDIEAENGVIHVIDSVLLPPQ
jgi:transforming growth factor-beta-induced protein